ncbi:hypothetical protein H5202_02370 [Shewanella sp. SG41-4]|uniref:hypothetical protein n=1 Tax=Shewanella sp. SG41-4 TaxID=2760976 RepID=UPI0016037879|nr:hypothetical protein [Shewanella sp. SG41-4]MBB1437532.1 hypothetical protein [Shewanella sp. SG41-4]
MGDVESYENYGEILKEAGELLDSYVVPIFCLDKFNRPEMEGTGFFLEYNLGIYFITASHVIDAIQSAKSHFIIAIHTEMFQLSLAGSKRTVNSESEVADSQFDLAAIQINPENDNYEQCQKLAIPTNKTTLNKSFLNVDMQILQGFPSSKNKTAKCLNNQTKHFSGALWTYSFNFFQNCNFSKFNKEAGSHYPIHWSKKIKGQKTLHPRGCSGGPYWFIPNKNKINEYYLAGVFIEYYEKDEIAFVTRIEHAIELVQQFDAKHI